MIKKTYQLGDKYIIGRREKVDFPDLGLYEIDAKVDTGAYTSAIHCHEVRVISSKNGKLVSFKLLDPLHPLYQKKVFKLPLVKKKTVKNSFGQKEIRFIVKTVIELFDRKTAIELSLANRSKMDFPVLLGRKLLNKNFIVDTARYNVSVNYLKNKNK